MENDLTQLQKKLVAAARADRPSDHVPYAFEQRIMAQLRALPKVDGWALWGGALWRAAVPCVAVMLTLGVWALVVSWDGSSSADLAVELEGTLLANVENVEQLDRMVGAW